MTTGVGLASASARSEPKDSSVESSSGALMRRRAPDLMPGISAEMGRQGPCPSLPKPLFG